MEKVGEAQETQNKHPPEDMVTAISVCSIDIATDCLECIDTLQMSEILTLNVHKYFDLSDGESLYTRVLTLTYDA